VSELIHVHQALLTGEHRFSRAAALANANSPLAAKVRKSFAHRFLTNDPNLVNETGSYLLSFFRDLWDQFREHPFFQISAGIPQAVDCCNAEINEWDQACDHAEALQRYLQSRWERKFREIHLLKSAFWNMEDFLLIVDGDDPELPSVEDFADLACVHQRLRQQISLPIFLFFRLGHVCFPITPVIPADLHRGLLTPATAPDVFLQLGQPEVYWSDHTHWYLCQWRTNEQWSHAPEFKQMQLDLIARGAENGTIVYPLTLKAIEREAQRNVHEQDSLSRQ
jgi:hypothetical protein